MTSKSTLTTFSKVADLNVPDSPPPEKEDDIPGAQPGMTKFDSLMKAAVSIKTAQLDQKKKKFEKLPTFLKAGVYYSNKLECVRQQSEFQLKIFSFEIIRDEGLREYREKNYDRACRKFEEALSIFRYHISFNPKWQEQGIDDDEIREIDDFGKNDFERQELKKLKLSLYLNIAACNLKSKDYDTAVCACNEALKLDPYNLKALYRRARALSLPINSGVEDFRLAITDLKNIIENIDPLHGPALRELKRLQHLVDVTRRREKETYAKMFSGKGSGCDYPSPPPTNFKTQEDLEFEREKKKLEEKVRIQMQAKLAEFSFEVLPEHERRQFPEMEDLQGMIDKAEESYRLFKKTGRGKEAKIVKTKLEEAIFAKEHLFHVMNLDFSKPTAKLIAMAQKNHIDLADPSVLDEFKRIQQQNLDDIRRMREGKRPLTEEELRVKREGEREAEAAAMRARGEEAKRRKEEGVRRLVENAVEAGQMAGKKIEREEGKVRYEQIKHYIALGIFMALWIGFIVYQNASVINQDM